jgi:parvulin-like peptidyl-prolyl isomerase
MTPSPRLSWTVIAVVCAFTAAVVILSWPGGAAPLELAAPEEATWSGDTVARVGGAVLLGEDLTLAGLDPSTADEWVEDELLAQLAFERGLENPRLSAMVQQRARQLYLRDSMLAQAYGSVAVPSDAEVMEFMRSDSELYMIERHYYHILLPDSGMADSLMQKLARGESFQIAAERLSMGQTAGVGGEMGYLVGGELTAFGLPREDVLITGLGGVIETSQGWHILMVDDVRPLTDTVRVVHSISDVLYRQRLSQAGEELLQEARRNREVRTAN